MGITKLCSRMLGDIFPNALIDGPIDRRVWIRTVQWQVDARQLTRLRNLQFDIESIMIEGDSITLVLDKESSKKAIAG